MRQLENAVFRAVVLADGDTIGMEEFPQIAAQLAGLHEAPPAAPDLPGHGTAPAPALVDVPPMLDIGSPLAGSSKGSLSLFDDQGQVRPLEEIEAEAIRFAIAHYRGQMSEVARRLRIGRSTLYRKLDSLGLDAEADGVS